MSAIHESVAPSHVAQPLDHLAETGDAAAPALVLRAHTIDYQGLRDRVGKLAAWLTEQVPAAGARVASWASKGELTCLMPLAAARAGLVHVPINPLLKRAQAAYILADCGASLLIANSARMDSLERGDVPALCTLASDEETLELAYQMQDGLPPSSHDPNALAAILYTSGSTGRPKGVMLSHANMWLGAVSVASYLELCADDVVLAVLPLSFDYGQSQLLSTWYAGGSAVPLDYLFPRDVAQACARHGITTLAAVPPLWVQLTEADWPDDAAASIRRITNSGGALTSPLIAALRKVFSAADIFPMYGLTEAFRSTYLRPELVAQFPASMGTAIPFAEILIVDEESKVAAPGVEGELVHCGPLVAQGYWQDGARTQERFRPAPAASKYGGIAVWSGDRAVRDKNGLLYFRGRRDAMIKSAGNRISPQEIEDAARATGLVAEAAALGVADERLGHAVHLVVRAAPGAEDAERALPKALARELPTFMQPHTVHWKDTMPTNPNGKIDRAALLRELTA